jgi:hypothetical protein
MWARVKGETENAILKLPFKAAYMFRLGLLQPLHGERPKIAFYRFLYPLMGPLISPFRAVFPQYVTTSEQLGRAMITAAEKGAPKAVLEVRDINRLADGDHGGR